MYHPIFVSGPHGSGKTTLLNKLFSSYDDFVENNFDIDFLSEFPNMKILSNYERCLLRLYHRIYLTNYAHSFAAEQSNKYVITSRGIYDSAAYIHTYESLNWFSSDQKDKLSFILDNSGVKPYTIVLNPPAEVVVERLLKRRNEGTRKLRDDVFISEDSNEFILKICEYFSTLKDEEHVLYLEDNSEKDIKKIFDWIKKINNGKQATEGAHQIAQLIDK